MSEKKVMRFPEHFYWGETVRGTVARPCQIFLVVTNKNIDKVYSICKQSLLTLHSQQKEKYTFLLLLICVSKMQRHNI